MLKPIRTIAPAQAPVSLDLIKQHLRIDTDAEDSLLEIYIDAAVAHLDGYSGMLGRGLITQTWQQRFPKFPHRGETFGLVVEPVQSITAVSYYDADNAAADLDAGVYALLEDELGAFVTAQVNNAWPDAYSREDAVAITYVAGYGDNAEDVPTALRQAIMLLAGHWYENREPTAGAAMAGLSAEIPFAVTALTEPYRRKKF